MDEKTELLIFLGASTAFNCKNSIRDITGQDWGAENKEGGTADYPCCR